MHIAVVVCGAPLARRANELIQLLRDHDHDITACPTPASTGWAAIDDRVLPQGRIRPDAVIVAPATFNTLNKWAAGINDSPVLGLLNDSLGLHTPVLVVPMVAERLANHPAWPRTIALLITAGVAILDPVTGAATTTPQPIASGCGDEVADRFPLPAALSWIDRLQFG